MRTSTLKIILINASLLALYGCASNMDNYISAISNVKNRAQEKFGTNNGYDNYALVGSKSVWANKTCLDFFSGSFSFNEDNTFTFLDRGSLEDVKNSAISNCEKKAGACVLVMVLNKCVLDDKGLQRTNITQPYHPPKVISTPSASIDTAKDKCSNLGFKIGTESFGKCVLQLSK
jgi:PBP1b-binding outer membrane lipoprotein LpoB